MSFNHLMTSLQNFEFLWPWMLAFLPLPWIIRILFKPAVQKQTPLLAPHLVQRVATLNANAGHLLSLQAKPKLPILFMLMWIALILAAMRPVWFLTPTPFETTGRDIVLAVDLSGSMEKPDMIVNGRGVDRLTAIKGVVDEFIVQRQGDRMALIVFGSQAFLVSPLTYDLNSLQQMLAETEIGMAGNNTAIGDAIGLTIKHLKETRQQKAVLILLTDGSNNAGAIEPLDAAEKAKQAGLVVHTIAFGSIQTRRGLTDVLRSSEIDLDTLQNIADLTGGQAFIAGQTDQLAEIYQRINELEAKDFTLNQFRSRNEMYTWPLAFALFLSLCLAWSRLNNTRGEYGA